MRSSESSRNYPVYSACILVGAFTLYTLFSSHITAFGYALTFAVLALSYLYYRSLGASEGASQSGAIAAALSLYSITTIILFYPTANTIFRSDDWIILSMFESIDGFSLESIRKIALFEMFGDIRFQPLAHLLLFVRYLLFGSSILPYHLLNMALHVITGMGILLILVRTTKNPQLSFIGGLIFITLPGQFDTVAWTYHIYIITSTLAILGAIYLTLEYARTKKSALLAAALLLTLTSMLFYEPAIAAPGALLIIISGLYITDGTRITRRELATTAAAVGVIYAFYIGLTLYGLSLTRETHFVSFSDMVTAGNMYKAVMVTARNLWESTFIKNIGITPAIGVADIIYLMIPKELYTDFAPLVKIAIGLFILSLLRPGRNNRHIAIALCAIALSYIYIISLGRVLTNPATYVPSQSRYQYLPNAMLLTTAGIFLVRKFQDKGLRPLISVVLFAVLFWNLSNTMYANNMVAMASVPLDYHHLNIKEFLESNPSARLRLNLRPGADWKFYLGSNIAFDLMFKERLTKFQEKATHIYDGEGFRENRGALNRGDGLKGEVLGGFTAEWLYHRRKNTIQTNPITIIGPGETYPKISIAAGERVKVDMMVSGSSEVHSFSLAYPSPSPDTPGPIPVEHMVIEKDDNVLCLAYNGILVDKIKLNTAYRQWNSDGLGLYGEYFRGSGEPVLIMDLQFSPDMAKRGCKDRPIGAIITPELFSIKKKTDKP